MTVTSTYTVRTICIAALKKAGVIAQDSEAAEPFEIDTAMTTLHIMLKRWHLAEFKVATLAAQSVSLTTSASYTMSPVRPADIATVNFKKDGIETPMVRMTRQEYDELPDKTTIGQPTQYYYDKQRESALLYIWPVLASASGETLEITYWRELEDVIDLDSVIDVPAEWYEAVIYNLADRLCHDFEIDKPMITMHAREALASARAMDVEGSVFIGGDYA